MGNRLGSRPAIEEHYATRAMIIGGRHDARTIALWAHCSEMQPGRRRGLWTAMIRCQRTPPWQVRRSCDETLASMALKPSFGVPIRRRTSPGRAVTGSSSVSIGVHSLREDRQRDAAINGPCPRSGRTANLHTDTWAPQGSHAARGRRPGLDARAGEAWGTCRRSEIIVTSLETTTA
jgi:hypothetical protein